MLLLEDDRRRVDWQDYTATLERQLVRLIAARFGAEYDPPSWLDIVYPQRLKAKGPAPEAAPARSSIEEDKAHIMKIFGIDKLPERR